MRSEEKAKVLQDKFGVKTVAGSIKDYAFVEKVVQDYHVVFQIVREFSCSLRVIRFNRSFCPIG